MIISPPDCYDHFMYIECPECHALPTQGANYAAQIELADAGEFTAMCAVCGHSWRPSPAEQKLIANNIKQYVADNNL
jgi:hypothetical protein